MKRAWVVAVGLSLVACGDDPGIYDAYDDENVTVLGTRSSDDYVVVARAPGDDCIDVGGDACIRVDEDSDWCGGKGGPVDVVIVDGEVVETVCYRPTDGRRVLTVNADTQGDINVVQSANNTAIVFDDDLNGTPFAGNISIDGNNVAIYGNGPDATIIDGDVVVSGNNVRIRGVTITGNLTIELNNAAVLLSRIHGNVTIAKNNTVFVENDVFGDVSVTANNTLLVGNDVQGAWRMDGNGSTCTANYAFSDAPEPDYRVDDDEVGAALTCN